MEITKTDFLKFLVLMIMVASLLAIFANNAPYTGSTRWLWSPLVIMSFIVFLKRLIKGSSRKIYLILDNLKVHHSKIVKAWREKHTEEIEIFFLSSYSPEINPDEYLNNDLKSAIGLKQTPKNHKHMKSNVKSHMIFLQKNPKRVARFFHHKSIKYAAA